MKKKILAIIATLFVVCSLGFGVAACNSISADGGHVTQQGNGNTTQGSGSSNGDSNNGNTTQGNSSSNGDSNNGNNGGAQANTPTKLTGLKYEFVKYEVSFDPSVPQEDRDLINGRLDEYNEEMKDDIVEFINETTVMLPGGDLKFTRDGNVLKIDAFHKITLSGNILIVEEDEELMIQKATFKMIQGGDNSNDNNGNNGGAQENTPSNLTGLIYKFYKLEVSYDSGVPQEIKDELNRMLDEYNEEMKDYVIEFINETTVVAPGGEYKYTRVGNTIKMVGESSYGEATLSGNNLIFEEEDGYGVTHKATYKKI